MGKLMVIFLAFAACVALVSARGARLRRRVADNHHCVTYCDLSHLNRTMCNPVPDPVPENRVNSTQQLHDLREQMVDTTATGGHELHAYLIYEGSYYGGGVTDHDRRMRFISGFTGSAGNVIVTTDKAALWTDGRYWLQGDQELDCNWILMRDGDPTYPDEIAWLLDILPAGANVGVDPAYIDTQTYQSFETAFANDNKNISLIEVPQDLIDFIWTSENGRPEKLNNHIYEHTINFTGEAWSTRVTNTQAELAEHQVLIVTLLDDIVWTFNLRGSDRTYSPVFDSMAFIFHNSVTLYINNMTKLLNPEIQAHLQTSGTGVCNDVAASTCITVKELSDSMDDLMALAADNTIESIWINPDVAYDLYKAAGEKRHQQASPIQLPKSQKNAVELRNYAACQIRDSVILTKFIAELENDIANGVSYTEMSAGEKLDNMRKDDVNNRNKMLSFATIAGYGTNGAVIHYRATEATDKAIGTDSLFLLDSGGNYLDGTTDVTRTFHFGTPTAEHKEVYTRVLLGVIDLATTVWPQGWRGSDIDVRARTPIWQNGWDFNHGTGHGIAYFINVHEGPARISIWGGRNEAKIYPNMTFSDEPGIYLDGKFGVRLETIVQVVKADVPNRFNDVDYLTFWPLTLVPFEPHLINYDLLDISHRKWLNSYHARVRAETGSHLADHPLAQAWLNTRTEPIPETPMWQEEQEQPSSAGRRLPAVWLVLAVVGMVNVLGW